MTKLTGTSQLFEKPYKHCFYCGSPLKITGNKFVCKNTKGCDCNASGKLLRDKSLQYIMTL